MTEVQIPERVAFVAALDIPRDGVIVLKSQRRITREMAATLREEVAEKFPGHEVIVLPPDLDIDVVREVKS